MPSPPMPPSPHPAARRPVSLPLKPTRETIETGFLFMRKRRARRARHVAMTPTTPPQPLYRTDSSSSVSTDASFTLVTPPPAHSATLREVEASRLAEANITPPFEPRSPAFPLHGLGLEIDPIETKISSKVATPPETRLWSPIHLSPPRHIILRGHPLDLTHCSNGKPLPKIYLFPPIDEALPAGRVEQDFDLLSPASAYQPLSSSTSSFEDSTVDGADRDTGDYPNNSYQSDTPYTPETSFSPHRQAHLDLAIHADISPDISSRDSSPPITPSLALWREDAIRISGYHLGPHLDLPRLTRLSLYLDLATGSSHGKLEDLH